MTMNKCLFICLSALTQRQHLIDCGTRWKVHFLREYSSMVSNNSVTTPSFPNSRIVNTASGPIIGRKFLYENSKPVDAFQGIPYARPPIGELRFKKPLPPKPWTKLLKTQAFGASSVQWEDANINKALPVSEDCLTLNVFTPTWQPENPAGFPVMIYFHGGGCVRGSSVTMGDVKIGEHLVSKDVIIVTVQYRLGFLGFWTTGCEKCPGNWGLWDTTLALKWIQRNIVFFNGDSSNVTVMGNCAGGDIADLLSLSPHSRDLFHKVICMSGNASCEGWSIHYNSVESCRRKAVKMGIHTFYDTDKYLEDIRKLPAWDLGTVFWGDVVGKDNLMESQIGPRIDGDFITKPVAELRKEAPPKPRMIGCCRYDGLFFPVLHGKFDYSLSSVEESISSILTEKDHPANCGNLRKEIFRRVLEKPREASQDEINRAHIEVLSDNMLNIGTQLAVIEAVKTTEPVYFYCFEYFNPEYIGRFADRTPFLGATHLMELPFLFGVPFPFNFKLTEQDLQVLQRFTTFFANFAKYSDPNGKSTSEAKFWQPATSSNPQRHLKILAEPKMSEEFRKGRPMLYLPKAKL